MKKIIGCLFFLVLSFAFLGISYAQDVTVNSNTTWQAGTYTYDNVLVTNGATLTFNGAVTLNARNITIDSTSSISADGKGYLGGYGAAGQGPGGGIMGYYGSGAGYGGKGGPSGAAAGATYGSAIKPVDLGSGGGYSRGSEYYHAGGGPGGGAIMLNIQNSLTLNGTISANGGDGLSSDWVVGGGGSGGSIYAVATNLIGSGIVSANGGRGTCAGGGGRIAVYYQSSAFSGRAEAKGGIGANPEWNGEDGTTAFIDQQNNILFIGNSFRFQENDSPFNFTRVILNNSKVTSQGSISLTTEQLLLNNSAITLNDTANLIVSNASAITNSSFSFTGAQSLKVPLVTLNNSTLLLSGKETLSLTNLTLNNNSTLTHSPQGKIDLSLVNLTLDATSFISTDSKGYPTQQGPGTGESNVHGRNGGGAGYGGKGGDGAIVGGWTARGGATYGIVAAPTDLGSGGGTIWHDLGGAGGGAVNLMIFDTFTLNGKITVNGEDGKTVTSSGETFSGGAGSAGSVYIIANRLSGAGSISANGGKGGGWGGGGGGGGRIAVYYKTSTLAGKVEAKGGTGCQNGEDGTIVFQPISLDTPITTFNILEKSSTISTSQETLITKQLNLNNLQISGDLTGTLSFTNLTLTTLSSGAFSGEGFMEAEFQTTLEGGSYQGNLQGVVYPVLSENKIYLKGSISGFLINGIAEGYLTESVPGSGAYDKLQATWKLNRLGTDTLSATLNLEGTISSQSSHTFTSGVYMYQADFEGDALGSYTGPLSAVLTYLSLTGENENKGKGFSIISYNSLLGQGEGFSYNKVLSEGIVEFNGLFRSPLLGRLSDTILDETKSPKTLSGTIERLDLGVIPAPDLKVNVWGPAMVSPGQTFDYIIELRNDGLKSAEKFAVVDELPWQAAHISNTGGGIYKDFSRRIIWNLDSLSAKSQRYLTVKSELEWELPNGMVFGNLVTLPKEDIAIKTDPTVKINYELINAAENHINANAVVSNQLNAIPLNIDLSVKSSNIKVEPNFEEIHELGNSTEYRGKFSVRDDRLFRGTYTVVEFLARQNVPSARGLLELLQVFEGTMESADGFAADQLTLIKLNSAGKISDGLYEHLSGANSNKLVFVPVLQLMERFRDYMTVNPAIVREVSAGIPEVLYQRNFDISVLAEYTHDTLKRDELLNKKTQAGVLSSVSYAVSSQPGLVAAARDPNELLVSPEGNVKPGDKLTYTINYENEGEGDAYGVYVTDTLLDNLDDTTLVVNNGGKYNSGTRTISWFIGELPSKQKGSLTFSVNVNKDAQDKAAVINFATVYFPSVPETTRTNGTVNRITTSVDNVAPITLLSAAPLANDAGWNKSDVTITLTATDSEGGSGVNEIHYKLAGAETREAAISGDATQISIITEGITTLTYWAIDNNGNSEMAKSLEIKLDKTPPVIIPQALPRPNSSGWNNSEVTVSFAATDSLSGVATVTQPQAITTEGANQGIGGETTDLADNKASTHVTLNIDKTLPQITLKLNPVSLSEKDKEEDKDEDKDDESEDIDTGAAKQGKGNWYQLLYSATDSLSGVKALKAGLVIISIKDYKIKLKPHRHLKIRIDQHKKELKIKAPNPQEILTQLQNGLLNLNSGQALQLKLRQGKPKWKIKQKEKGLEIQAPSILFKATASDYADNLAIKELEFNR